MTKAFYDQLEKTLIKADSTCQRLLEEILHEALNPSVDAVKVAE